FNTPHILGAFSSPPYYHNGACETIACVLLDKNHRQAGLKPNQPDPLETKAKRAKLAVYVESIDERTAIH
ncbi:MAG: hypothetical protein HRT35_38650, partial [Algicola sp.]|nr:hypothetical protein [Algicola sp.]